MKQTQSRDALTAGTIPHRGTTGKNTRRTNARSSTVILMSVSGLLLVLSGVPTLSFGGQETPQSAQANAISNIDIPPSVQREVASLKARYQDPPTRAAYHQDGDCMAERFLQERLARGPSVRRGDILNEIKRSGECVDSQAVYRLSSEICFNSIASGSLQSRTDLTDQELEGHCHCVAQGLKEQYSVPPVVRNVDILEETIRLNCFVTGPHQPPDDTEQTAHDPVALRHEPAGAVHVDSDAIEPSPDLAADTSSADVADQYYHYCIEKRLGARVVYGQQALRSPSQGGMTDDRNDPQVTQACQCFSELMVEEFDQFYPIVGGGGRGMVALATFARECKP